VKLLGTKSSDRFIYYVKQADDDDLHVGAYVGTVVLEKQPFNITSLFSFNIRSLRWKDIIISGFCQRNEQNLDLIGEFEVSQCLIEETEQGVFVPKENKIKASFYGHLDAESCVAHLSYPRVEPFLLNIKFRVPSEFVPSILISPEPLTWARMNFNERWQTQMRTKRTWARWAKRTRMRTNEH